MGIRTVIPGPPGTGKTFRLVNHYLEKEINEYKTDPQKIIFISYSNAAINDVSIKHNLLYISTMHRLGTKELKINTTHLIADTRFEQVMYRKEKSSKIFELDSISNKNNMIFGSIASPDLKIISDLISKFRKSIKFKSIYDDIYPLC